MSAASVTRTRFAATASVVGLEEVMPRPEKNGPVLLHQRRNLVQLILRESAVRRHCHRFEPELRDLPLARDVNVRWFGPVATTGTRMGDFAGGDDAIVVGRKARLREARPCQLMRLPDRSNGSVGATDVSEYQIVPSGTTVNDRRPDSPNTIGTAVAEKLRDVGRP